MSYPPGPPGPPDPRPADPAAPMVPPDVWRTVARLSDPVEPAGDPYVLMPPRAPDLAQRGLGDRATEALLAGIAHAAIIFGFLGVGFLLSLAINLVLFLYARRSPYVSYHAQQAGCYQCFVVIFNIILIFLALLTGGFFVAFHQWSGAGWLSAALWIFLAVWFVGSIVYGVVGAVRVFMGRPFSYPVFGPLAARTTRR